MSDKEMSPVKPASYYRKQISASRRIWLILLLPAILFPACTTLGPDFVKPAASVEKKWHETDDNQIKAETADYSTWWRVLGDPVLDNLITMACKQNLSLRVAGLRILEARAVLGIAVGLQYPQSQSLSGGYAYQKSSRNAPPLSELPDTIRDQADTSADVFQAGFNAAWELDFWGKFRRGVEAADAGLAAPIPKSPSEVAVGIPADLLRRRPDIRLAEFQAAAQGALIGFAVGNSNGIFSGDSLVGFIRTQQQEKFLAGAAEAADRATQIALLQYKEGLTDYTRVLNTQQLLVAQQDTLASSRGDIIRYLIAVYKSLGGGWESRVGKDIIPEKTLETMRKRTDWGGLLEPISLPAEPEQLPTGKEIKPFNKPMW